MIEAVYHSSEATPAGSQDSQQTNNPVWGVGHIVIRPNNSMSWKALKFFLATLLTISLAVGIAFLFQGFWLILPFTIIEMSIVGYCLYYIARRAQFQQVLRFSGEEIVLEQGSHSVESKIRWPRYFSKFFVEPPPHPWYSQRIFLRHADESVELGRFLTQGEKQSLVRELAQMVEAADRALRKSASA